MISLARSTAAMLIALTATAAAESSPRTSADMLLPGCEILIGADPRGSAELLADAGHCYGLIEGLSYASRALGFCPPADATLAQMARLLTSKRVPNECTKTSPPLRLRRSGARGHVHRLPISRIRGRYNAPCRESGRARFGVSQRNCMGR
jgi:hypothetical protein